MKTISVQINESAAHSIVVGSRTTIVVSVVYMRTDHVDEGCKDSLTCSVGVQTDSEMPKLLETIRVDYDGEINVSVRDNKS